MKCFLKTGIAAAVAFTLLAVRAPVAAQAVESPRALLFEDFSSGIEGWTVQRLNRRLTQYLVVDVDGESVLKANSNDAAAALLLPLAQPAPAGQTKDGRLRWRWRVMNSLTENLKETERSGDDYAARVFVLFGSAEIGDETRALSYVWAGNEPVGSRYPNPNAEQVATIVLQSGDEHAGEWVVEERDVFDDYARSFGEPPPDLAGIALLVDTDDTGTAAMAWFDKIELLAGRAP